MTDDELERLRAKTNRQRFVQVLEQAYDCAPRVATSILEEAQACLLGGPGQLQPGQVRVVLVRLKAAHGRALRETDMTEVIWTIDAGQEDRETLRQFGTQALRQVRIQRLLSEAIEQGAVATQEDLAWALHASVRTIKRDSAELETQGIYLPTRGHLQGIGRGQTHKARIVGEWLQGRTYDEIELSSRHSLSSIQRYVQAFVRVVHLQQEGFDKDQVARLLAIGPALVEEYLAVYGQHASPACRQRLAEQMQRLTGTAGSRQKAQKGGQ
jgi:hypothetical protein